MVYARINYRTIGFGISVMFALVFIMPVFFLNKPLVWDDWVWVHNSPDQLRDVAIQLGLWWLADLNVFIYSLHNPNLFLSLIAFCSHLISIAVLSRAFIRLKILNDIQCGIWVACCILSPFLLVRYINSVAFYNLYFATFVCAAYLFIFFENKFAKLLSVPLFIISFSLNSLIPAYFVIILFADREFSNSFLKSLVQISLRSTQCFSNVWYLTWSRLLKTWPYLTLPFVFFAIKTYSPYDKVVGNPYESYNLPQFDVILWSPLLTLERTLHLSLDVIWHGLFGIDSILLLLGLVSLTVLYLIKRIVGFRVVLGEVVVPFGVLCRKNIILLFVFSVVLVFPYILVGKPPVLLNFVEARHLITVQPFILAIAVLVISNVGDILSKFTSKPRLISIVLLTMFASICAWRSAYLASAIWWEDKTSKQIIETIRYHQSDIKFWVFDNHVPQYLDTTQWNYVYTGFLISAFSTKDNFGISKGEYLEWQQPVKLLNDPYYRQRYNIENYVHQDSYNYVTTKLLKQVTKNTVFLMYLAETFGYKHFNMNDIISTNVFNEFGCVDEAVLLFFPDVQKEKGKTLGEISYCKNKLKSYCADFSKGEQVTHLNQMDYAYAIQKYPSILAEDGLHLFKLNTDFTQIAKRCSLISYEPNLPMESK